MRKHHKHHNPRRNNDSSSNGNSQVLSRRSINRRPRILPTRNRSRKHNFHPNLRPRLLYQSEQPARNLKDNLQIS